MPQQVQQTRHEDQPFAGVFLSYSRDDAAFVERLHAGLEAHDIAAHLDRDDIEKSEDWWERLKQLITESDTIVFVLSPHSAVSEICRREVEFAAGFNKRFIPVVAAVLGDVEPPSALQRLNYIFFVPDERAGASGDFEDALAELVRALETDIDWIREHTRVGSIAERWQERSEPREMLLRGSELEAAERWLAAHPPTAPDPTAVIARLIHESRRASIRRQRQWVAGSLTVAAFAIGLATFALIQWNRAEAELRTATAQRLAVQSRTALAEALQPGGMVRPDVDRSVLVALESLKVERSVEADRALRTALLHLPGPGREIRVESDLELVALGPGGAWIAVAEWREPPGIVSEDGIVDPTPEQQALIDAAADGSARSAEPGEQESPGAHPDFGLRDLTAEFDAYSDTARELYDRKSDARLAVLPQEWFVRHSHFRSDAAYVLTLTSLVSADPSDTGATRLFGSTLYVWEVPNGELRSELSFAGRGGVHNFSIDPGGNWIALQTGFDTEGSLIVVLPIWPDLVVEEACRRIRRNFSPTEVAEYLPGREYIATCEGLEQISE